MKGIYQYRDLEILKHKFLYDEIPKFNYTIGGDGVSGYRHTEDKLIKWFKENYPNEKLEVKI